MVSDTPLAATAGAVREGSVPPFVATALFVADRVAPARHLMEQDTEEDTEEHFDNNTRAFEVIHYHVTFAV